MSKKIVIIFILQLTLLVLTSCITEQTSNSNRVLNDANELNDLVNMKTDNVEDELDEFR